MKSIPDVEKLKKEASTLAGHFRLVHIVEFKKLIDSLAIEMEEGAITEVIEDYESCLVRNEQYKKWHDNRKSIAGAARVELAALKEEREYLERVIKHLAIKLVRERGHNDAIEVLDEVTNARIQARKE